MTTRFTDHLPGGDHASRPDPATTPVGSLYSCTEHQLIYKNDGAAWTTWATVGGRNVLLLEAGGVVPPETAAGVIVFEKA